MLATIINAVAILVGSFIGLFFRKRIHERASGIIFSAAGTICLLLGIQMGLKSVHILALALSLFFGGLAGMALDIEGAIERLGGRLKRRFAKDDDSGPGFAVAFLDSTLLFCTGAMAIVGSFRAGTEGDYTIILTKSVLDGFISIMFASTMGLGVAFSALSVFLYQGVLTVAAVYLKPYVSEALIAELTGVGGVMVLMIGFNLLGMKRIRTGDFLPALLVVVALSALFRYIPIL